MQAIRVMIKRRKELKAKKIMDNNRELWLIHRDTVNLLCTGDGDQITTPDHHDSRATSVDHQAVITTVAELFERQRKEIMQERDQALQGLMMYRYKFEELDRQLRMLPAPPEVVNSKLQELEQERQHKSEALAQAQKILKQAQEVKERYKGAMQELKAKLQEEERAKEALRVQWEQAQAELKRPWWKKIFGKK